MEQDRFVDDEELVGRTIAKVRLHSLSVDILFTDGTYTTIAYDGGYYLGEGDLSFRCLRHSELSELDGQEKPFDSC